MNNQALEARASGLVKEAYTCKSRKFKFGKTKVGIGRGNVKTLSPSNLKTDKVLTFALGDIFSNADLVSLTYWSLILDELGVKFKVNISPLNEEFYSYVEGFLSPEWKHPHDIRITTDIRGVLLFGDSPYIKSSKVIYALDGHLCHIPEDIYDFTLQADGELVQNLIEALDAKRSELGSHQETYYYKKKDIITDKILSGIVSDLLQIGGPYFRISPNPVEENGKYLAVMRKPGDDIYLLAHAGLLNPRAIITKILGLPESFVIRMNKDMFGKMDNYGTVSVRKESIWTEESDGNILINKYSSVAKKALKDLYGEIPIGTTRAIVRMMYRHPDGKVTFIKGAGTFMKEWDYDVDVIIPNNTTVKGKSLPDGFTFNCDLNIAAGEFSSTGVDISRQSVERILFADDIEIRKGFEDDVDRFRSFILETLRKQTEDIISSINNPQSISKTSLYRKSYKLDWNNDSLGVKTTSKRLEVEDVDPTLKKVVKGLPLSRTETNNLVLNATKRSYYANITNAFRSQVEGRDHIKEGDVEIYEYMTFKNKERPIDMRKFLSGCINRDGSIYIGGLRLPCLAHAGIYKVTFIKGAGNVVYMNNKDLKEIHQGDNDDAMYFGAFYLGKMKDVNLTKGKEAEGPADLTSLGVYEALSQAHWAQRAIAPLSYLVGLSSFYKSLNSGIVSIGGSLEQTAVQEIKKKMKESYKMSYYRLAKILDLPVKNVKLEGIDNLYYSVARGRNDLMGDLLSSSAIKASSWSHSIFAPWLSVGSMFADRNLDQRVINPENRLHEVEKALIDVATRFVNADMDNDESNHYIHNYNEVKVMSAIIRHNFNDPTKLRVEKKGPNKFRNLLYPHSWSFYNRCIDDDKFVISKYVINDTAPVKTLFYINKGDCSITKVSGVEGRRNSIKLPDVFSSIDEVRMVFNAITKGNWKGFKSIPVPKRMAGVEIIMRISFSNTRQISVIYNKDKSIAIQLTLRSNGKFNDGIITLRANDAVITSRYLNGDLQVVKPDNTGLSTEDLEFIRYYKFESARYLMISSAPQTRNGETYEMGDVIYMPSAISFTKEIMNELVDVVPRHIVFKGFIPDCPYTNISSLDQVQEGQCGVYVLEERTLSSKDTRMQTSASRS